MALLLIKYLNFSFQHVLHVRVPGCQNADHVSCMYIWLQGATPLVPTYTFKPWLRHCIGLYRETAGTDEARLYKVQSSRALHNFTMCCKYDVQSIECDCGQKIKSFCTLHTVGHSGSFRVGVKTTLACYIPVWSVRKVLAWSKSFLICRVESRRRRQWEQNSQLATHDCSRIRSSIWKLNS